MCKLCVIYLMGMCSNVKAMFVEPEAQLAHKYKVSTYAQCMVYVPPVDTFILKLYKSTNLSAHFTISTTFSSFIIIQVSNRHTKFQNLSL